MIRSKLILLAAALLIAPGCAKKVKTSWADEPGDPTGEDLKKKKEDLELKKLLADTVLHFGFDEATLTTADQTMLQEVASALRTRPWVAIRIAGHADERGTEEYNLALGQKRADAARSYLTALGVRDDQIDSVSFGEEAPAVDESNEEAWAWNRRDELGLLPLDLYSYLDGKEQKR
jgi:peptidoglycan-associated lipoprotein